MSCETIPTRTLFGTSVVGSTVVTTSFSTSFTTLPDVTRVLSTTSCVAISIPVNATLSGPTCTDTLVPFTTVIQGSASPVVVGVPKTVVEDVLTTVFPTDTLFLTSCSSSSTSTHDTTPTSTSTSAVAKPPTTSSAPATPESSSAAAPASSSAIASSTGVLSSPVQAQAVTTGSIFQSVSGSVTFSVSQPPATTLSFMSAITTFPGGSVSSSNVGVETTFPASTLYNSPSNSGSGSNSNAPMIGGVVGGVVAFCIAAGVALCLMRRRRRKGAGGAYEKKVANEFGGRRLELDDDDLDDLSGGSSSHASKPTPYQYGLVGGTAYPETHDNTLRQEEMTQRRTSPSPLLLPRPTSASSPKIQPSIHSTSPSPTPTPTHSRSPSSNPNTALIPPSSPVPQQQVHRSASHRPTPSVSSSVQSADFFSGESPGVNRTFSKSNRQGSKSSISALLPRLKVTNAAVEEQDEREGA